MTPRAARELRAYLAIFPRYGLNSPVVTSTDRTPEHNQRVGGVPNSKHLYGLAADIVPSRAWPFTVSFRTLAGHVRGCLPHVEAIAESDHVHIEWPWGY